MFAQNRPEMEYRIVVVKRGGTRGRVARLRVITGDGIECTLASWEWLSGRPDTAQMVDMVAKLADEVEADLVTRYGVQRMFEPDLPSRLEQAADDRPQPLWTPNPPE
jgi:hypothetical protein